MERLSLNYLQLATLAVLLLTMTIASESTRIASMGQLPAEIIINLEMGTDGALMAADGGGESTIVQGAGAPNSCSKRGEPCGSPVNCCGNLVCVVEDVGGPATCHGCSKRGEPCGSSFGAGCCSNLVCVVEDVGGPATCH